MNSSAGRNDAVLFCSEYCTPWGRGIVVSDKKQVKSIYLPSTPVEELMDRARSEFCGSEVLAGGEIAEAACCQLERYFETADADFDFRIDLSGYTDFQARVVKSALSIPVGEVRTYGWLAQSVGRPGAARACGQVMAGNRYPVVVPCHRVVAAGGRLGGFSCGLDWKRRLLALEGAKGWEI